MASLTSLMKMVAGLTVSVLGWFDVISSQRGNLIDLSTGAVGIDEACSGIRSFQSTMMGALFLGELYLLSWRRRLWVLAGGVLLAVCFNVVRTLALTWWASETGIEALKKWHDPAGFSIFGATFASLWLLAWTMKKHSAAVAEAEAAFWGIPSPSTPQLSGFIPQPSPSTPQVSAFSPQPSPTPWVFRFLGPLVPKSLSPLVPESRSLRFLTALGLWSLSFIALTELWYVAHERVGQPPQQWYASLPATNATFQSVELSPRVSSNR